MSQMPAETELGGKYEPPCNTQFNVFLDNRVGRLMNLLNIFDGQALTLCEKRCKSTSKSQEHNKTRHSR